MAGRGVGGAAHRRRRVRQALPLPGLRPGDPARRRPCRRLARVRRPRRPQALAPRLLERQGPPHQQGAAVP
ncbi:hypothetical protein SBRY_11040 [Actinacidiphila bryophytorum]|uniref:Uncharacterized protein n=1 Tax=Actinacidiphila bryophytorum TaxID=1436133 RepID=A0A9W4GXR8_9ACTN|nr:hypothetical protein SBRY_11040 [Actinacidiphila bryophytorum]